MNVRFFLPSAVLSLLLTVLVGCGYQDTELPIVQANDVAIASATWKEKRLSDYDMHIRYRHGGFVPSASPVVIEVRGGKAVKIRPIGGDERPIHFYSKVDTVDKVFEVLRQSIAEGVEVKGTFESTYGYPNRVTGRFSKTESQYYDLSIDELVPASPLG